MLASIVNVLKYFPRSVLSKVGTSSEVVGLFHIALLRLSHALVGACLNSPRNCPQKGFRLSQLG